VLLAGGWICLPCCGVAGEIILSSLRRTRAFVLPDPFRQFQFFDRAGAYHLCEGDAALVPAWLPFRAGWAYLTGVGQIACGLGVLFSIFALWRQQRKRDDKPLAFLVWFSAILPHRRNDCRGQRSSSPGDCSWRMGGGSEHCGEAI